MEPFHTITMKPKEVCKLEITFAPKKRVPPFSEEVFMEWMGLLRPLFLLSGCCQALEISLDQEHLPEFHPFWWMGKWNSQSQLFLLLRFKLGIKAGL